MDTDQTNQQSLQINPEKFLVLVRALMGGSRERENDDQPLPPGPWDAVIRSAFEDITVLGPRPEPWKFIISSILARHPEIWDALGGGHSFGEESSLNPQPLPPRSAFFMAMAKTVISRAELIQEIADASRHEGEQQGIIIVSGYISRLVDEICGNGFRLKYPFPGPRPHWFTHELEGIDLVVMAAQFDQAAHEAYNPDLSQSLTDASVKLANAGLSMLR